MPERAGLLGEVPGCPVLVSEAACGRAEARSTLDQGLGAGCVQKGTHRGACSEKLESGPVGGAHHRSAQGCLGETLAALPYSNKLPESEPAAWAELHPVGETHLGWF